MLDSLSQDLRLAFRSLRKRPLYLTLTVLSLAIGIGANTAIFSAVNHLLLRGMDGIPNASRMVEIGAGRTGDSSLSYPDFLAIREQGSPLEEAAGFDMRILTLSRGEAGDRVFGMLVSANYFDVLGITAAQGRTFLAEEDEGPDQHPVVVLSHTFWQGRLGGDPGLVGSTVYVNRQPYDVVGVLPEEFRGHMAVGNPDVYVPLMQHPSLNEGVESFSRRGVSWFQVLGLLEPGSSVAEADAALKTVYSRLSEEYPETNANRTASARPYGALPAMIRGPAGMFLGVLMAFVGLILLITCANVAGMFLARATARKKEIAIRLSLGAGRGPLVRHLLTESLVIFTAGGIAGVFLALWGLDLLTSMDLPAPYPVSFDLSPDLGVLLFAAGLTLFTGLVFGLLPARQALELDLLSTLKDEGNRGGSRGSRLRRGFVTAQVGASLVLLVGASLLLRALQRAGEIETGFEPAGVSLTFLDLKTEGLSGQEGKVFQEEVLEYFSALGWVESAALSTDLPLDMSRSTRGVTPEGWTGATEDDQYVSAGYNHVSPDYFRTLRISVQEGRAFSDQDGPESERVAIVSRAFVDRVWPGESALGRTVRWGGPDDEPLTIVGVAENVQNQLLTDAPEPFIYRPLAQAYSAENNLIVRTGAEFAVATQGIQRGLRTLDPNISLSPVIDLERYTEVGILPQRIAGILSTSLGLLALLLSAMGVYGVMAFAVTRRTRELGIRIALGAEPGLVLRSVLAGGFRLALPGLAVGAVLAIGAAYLLRSLLLGVSPADPLALLGVAVTVAGMVTLGTLVPARRAARIHPAEALRYE
jgi:predicted permease